MKISDFIVTAIILTIICGFGKNAEKKTEFYYSIEDLAEKEAIKLNITGSGGYQGECIDFEIVNLTDSVINLKIEPGRRLVSIDSTLQDIFIVKEVKLEIIAFGKIKVKGFGFCCEASKGSPYEKAVFDVGFMADSSWIKIAEMINSGDYTNSVIQNAVWVLSDNFELCSVHSDDLEDIAPLRKTLAEIMGIEIPWYTLTYFQDTSMVFSDRPEKIFGEMEYYIANNCAVTINIRNSKGEVMQTLVKEIMTSPGTYKYVLNQDIIFYPKGEYNIYIYEDFSKINLKKKFNL